MATKISLVIAALLLLGSGTMETLAQSGSATQKKADTKIKQPTIISLSDSIEPLQTWFNADKDKPRMIAILSPT